MLKPNVLARAVALAVVFPGLALAELEISGEAKIEYDLFTEDGQVTGAPEPHDAGDALKTEASVKLFINSDIGEESAFHAELLLADDGEAASERLEGGEPYSQYEILREFYFDTNAGGWDFRLGKQQVVWGTADGIKLLDIINPTDFRELNQNVSEDSRIPVWMINAERDFDSGANIQFIISEAQPNFIAGLDEDGDSGAPFIFKGVDTITGKTNGFLNIARDMGQTSGIFQNLLQLGGLTGLSGGPMSLTTVQSFTQLTPQAYSVIANNLIQSNTVTNNPPPGLPNKSLLNAVFVPMMTNLGDGNAVLNMAANQGEGLFSGFLDFMMGDNNGLTMTGDPSLISKALSVQGPGSFANASEAEQDNIIASSALLTAMGLYSPGPDGQPHTADDTPWDLTDDNQRAQFATMLGSLTDEQKAAMLQTPQIQGMQQAFGNGTTNQFNGTLSPDNPVSAFDLMGLTVFQTFTSFIGMNTEYRREYDTDPFSDTNLAFRYKNSTDGGTNFSLNYAYRLDSNPYVEMHWEDSNGNDLNVRTDSIDMDVNGSPSSSPNYTGTKKYEVSVVTLTTANGAFSPLDSNGQVVNPATLVFEEKLNRVNTIGASFDTAIDTESVPVVVRGEFSYDVGTKQPVIDKARLAIGDLVGAMKMEDADMFKYVLGVDVTVLTNLMVSTQLIQFYNLDFIDEKDSCDTYNPATQQSSSIDCSRYTGDFTSMHLSNGLKKGDEVETFISFFLSKPFGSDGEHRWNNILIAENDGGYWNRFDVEYSFNDNMIGSVEYNKYWGDEDTMFGQFEKSSNLQLGFKYIF